MNGEDALVAALIRGLGPAASGEGVELGVGDDAAVLRPPPGRRLVATVDMLVEGQHFERQGPAAASPADVGWRALAVNLSDVAAMGARPLWALSSVGVPAGFTPADLEAVYVGLAEAAVRFGVAVVGGNLARVAERLVLDITILGCVEHPVTRNGGRPGDRICVTGRLGAAAAGLAVIRAGTDARARLPETDAALLLAAQRRPEPRMREGLALGRLAPTGVRAMCDVSDGLTRDLAHLCGADLGAVLWRSRLPSPQAVENAAALVGADPLSWVLGGGEDYELLCLVAPEAVDGAREAVARSGGVPLTVIGECVAGPGLRLAQEPGGEGRPLDATGWDPFRA